MIIEALNLKNKRIKGTKNGEKEKHPKESMLKPSELNSKTPYSNVRKKCHQHASID